MLESLSQSFFVNGELFLRLFLVILAGIVIGIEREAKGQDAGLRTHTMVGFGAALFTLASEQALIGVHMGDHSRVIAGVAQGIGFLGAGAILKESNRIKGLTTASSIWLMGAVGVAFGLGLYSLAILATILAWFVLRPLKRISKILLRNKAGSRSISHSDETEGRSEA